MSDEIERTALPIRRPQCGVVVNWALDGFEPDWNFVAPISPPLLAATVVGGGAKQLKAALADAQAGMGG
jgi:hypothetical protein